MDLSLVNKNALVCGSTQGIGKAAAEQLAAMGANVTLVARNEEKLKEVQAGLANNGTQKHDYIAVDFTQPETLKEKLATFAAYTKVNILVNNTGGPAGGPAHKAGLDEFQSAFSNHLLCNHILVQSVLEGMKASGYGRIINVISTSVKAPLPNLGVSNTIRGAVANWSKTLANELGGFNITVNNVLPGATKTVRLSSIIENKANKLGKAVSEIEEEMLSEIPMKRFADATEIANAIAFLASPSASYINGINVPVDGGRTGCL